MSDMMNAKVLERERMIRYIRERTSDAALYELMAEEAAELSHAASKMARILRGEVPTPKTAEKAMEDVVEEFSDLLNVTQTSNVFMNVDISNYKLRRWIERLNEKEKE